MSGQVVAEEAPWEELWGSSDRLGAFVLLDHRGRVCGASEAARAWLEQPWVIHALEAVPALFREAGCTQLAIRLGSSRAAVALLSRGRSRRYIVEVRTPAELTPNERRLSPAQRRVAHRAAAGASLPEIADQLHSSLETVRTHLREIYRRLDVGSRVDLSSALLSKPSRALRVEEGSSARASSTRLDVRKRL
jgi:DNA-binding CsgD family transcriptional regulator